MELEKGNAVPRDDPLDLEEGELREDQAATVATAADSAEMEVEADQKPPAAAAEEEEEENGKSSEKRRHGKRRSESGDANGEHDKKRSKKKSKKDNNSKRGGGGGDKGDDEEGTSTHKQHGDGAPDGEGDRRKRKEERSSANHHRDDHHSRHHHHRDHKDHKDRKDRHRDRGKHERSSSSSSASDDRRASEEERHSSSRSERERSRHSSSRERERERDSDGRGGRDGERGDRGRSSSREDRHHHHHARRRDDEPRHGGERQHERDRRGQERVEERDDHRHRGAAGERRYEREHERGRDDREDGRYDRGEDQRDHRRRDDHRHHRAGGYERGDDRRDRRSVEPAAERKPHERDDAKANQTDDADYARMVEEELRRKEKEQSEEEKTQKLIEERRKRRQAILEKYKQDKSAPADTAATATTAAGDGDKAEEAQAADAAAGTSEEKPKEEEEKEKEEKGTDEGKEKAEEGKPAQEQPEEPKKVTHFDMFNELPPALIPSDQKMQRPLGAAAATGEDELNLADNWDDEEGYYSFRIGEVINRRYTVHASHGKGVFSTVLIAKDSHNNDIDVAIKVIRNNDTMFRAGLKEKELLEKITAADPEDKKHCIRVLDSFQYRNHLCLVLEPMSMNLREVVKKFGRDVGITMRAVRTYARQLFLALKHLKKLNMLHADLKPDNIVLNAKLTVLKLCDFGSASLMEEENAITPYLVSRFYRAPEIMLGLPYDFGIDMWAAGCCLYEMYTGKILYAGKSNNEMLRMQMESMGPFPRKMLRKSKFWQRHFNTQTFYFQQICIDEVSQQEYVKEVNVVKPVRDLKAELQKAATAEDVSHAGQLADLMLKCLNLDPAKRLTPELALAHPFLKG